MFLSSLFSYSNSTFGCQFVSILISDLTGNFGLSEKLSIETKISYSYSAIGKAILSKEY
jgi:hypothetical protein